MEFSLGHTVDGVRSKYLADLTPDYVKLLLPKIAEITKQVRKNRWYKDLTGRELERVGKFIPLFLLGKNQVKHAQNTKNTKKKG